MMNEHTPPQPYVVDGATVYPGQHVPTQLGLDYSMATAAKGSATTTVYTIALPYTVPHVFITPRLLHGIGAIFSPGRVLFDNKAVERIHIRHYFSKFIDTYAPKGQDLTAFLYLGPDIMNIILYEGAHFTYEFVGDRIFVYHYLSNVRVIKGSVDPQDFLAARIQNDVSNLQDDFIAQLIRTARPAATTAPPLYTMRFSLGMTLFAALWPIVGAFLVGMFADFIASIIRINQATLLTSSPEGLMVALESGVTITMPLSFIAGPAAGITFLVVVFGYRYLREVVRYKKYQAAFGGPGILV